jgi:hypothetical protein
MVKNGTNRLPKGYIKSKAQRKRNQAQAKEINDAGKRAKVEKRLARQPKDPDMSAKALAQAKIDAAYRESISCKASEVKVFTPEEIAAIRHKITPIQYIRSAAKVVGVFAEPDREYHPGRRQEDSGQLRI